MNPMARLCTIAAVGAIAILPACSSDSTGSAADQVDASQSTDAGQDEDAGHEDGSAQSSGVDGEAEVTGLEMTNVATGESITMEQALDSSDGKPVLAWFWAPYCPTCRGEAPELDAFMADNADRVDMVGIGTLNDLQQAEGFLADTGVENFPLLWEPSGASWAENAVAAQPYMILLANGEEVERWPGGASVRQLEDALGQIS